MLQYILSKLRKAVTDYDLINENDNIAVGVSGGKDSYTLLTVLKAYQRFSPCKFSLEAVYVDMGFKNNNIIENIENYCKKIDVHLTVIKTDIAEIIFENRKEKNPCSLCSKMRRGVLCDTAKKLGCNKLALGHHQNDLIETFILSMLYESRLSTFLPSAYMDRTKITVIRPLIYVEEKEIENFSKNLPITKNPCPADKNTKREYIKNLLNNIEKDIPFAKRNIFSAIKSPDRYNLFERH